jgi:DNA polymerase/3'-5' exonuclease PolX
LQHSLTIDVKRDRVNRERKLVEGDVVSCFTEHDCFAALGVPYQPPHLRHA